MSATEQFAAALLEKLAPLSWEQRLVALGTVPGLQAVFSTSFSFEDQVITHVLATRELPCRIFTLDTGRLHEETHALHQRTRALYEINIETYAPDAAALQAYVAQCGVNGFYDSVENRKRCCAIRKVEPLVRALGGTDIWISGLRHEHSDNRSTLPCVAWDAARGVIKLYPLIDVDSEALWAYIRANNVPYSPLHDAGFPSIGCAPCTRAVQSGEHPRAGRWWWEQPDQNECGLHLVDGKLVRKKNAE